MQRVSGVKFLRRSNVAAQGFSGEVGRGATRVIGSDESHERSPYVYGHAAGFFTAGGHDADLDCRDRFPSRRVRCFRRRRCCAGPGGDGAEIGGFYILDWRF